MQAIYTFEETDRVSDQFPEPGIRVHSAVGCGRTFQDVACILEPGSPNPGFYCRLPLGVSGVQTILDMLKRRKGER